MSNGSNLLFLVQSVQSPWFSWSKHVRTCLNPHVSWLRPQSPVVTPGAGAAYIFTPRRLLDDQQHRPAVWGSGLCLHDAWYMNRHHHGGVTT
jgi:hypothetical protein